MRRERAAARQLAGGYHAEQRAEHRPAERREGEGQSGRALREKLESGVNLSGPVDMVLRAQTQLAEAGLPLNLEVVSKQLYWPFTGEKQFQADDLKLKLSGKMTDYTLSFRTAVKGQGVPPANITLDAKGNEQQVNLDKLTVAALEGKTELTALLDWQQAISWRGELKLTGINTAKEVPDWPSKLDGLIKTRGSLYGGTWQMDVPEIKLTGNVKQNKVNVEGSVKGNSYLQWVIPGLHVALGRNTADIKGELGVKDLNLDATIDAPNLDNALPGLGGTAKGLVKVRGTVDAPQLLADITANNLRWQELSVARVRVEGDVKSTDQIGGNLNLRVERISQPDVNINLVTLDAKGNEKQHDLQLRVQGEPVSGQLHLTGSFDRKEERWKGRWIIPVSTRRSGRWRCRAPSRWTTAMPNKRSALGRTAGPTRMRSCACRRPSMRARKGARRSTSTALIWRC
jgi:translocation and assembly module TamB